MDKSNTLPISVFIVTLNEAKNIERVIRSCSRMDEIIVVDSGSTDGTIERAKNLGATVSHNDWPGYAKQKAYAMGLCKNEWVLNLDADEELNEPLVNAFERLIANDAINAVRCQRRDLFMNAWPSALTKKPNNRRLYRKSKAHFDDSRLVHESADVDGKEVFIKEHFDHYGYDTLEVITAKNNDYSSLKALEKFQKGKKPSYLKLVLVFPLIFIKTYLLQRHCFSGMRGFVMSIATAYYLFIKEAKLYQLHKQPPNDG